MFSNLYKDNTANIGAERGAVLVELTYVIIFIMIISISTLELVNFIRHKKLAMGLSYEAANLIFRECPDIGRNTIEFNSYNTQNTESLPVPGTPADVKDCLGRNLDDFRVFLASNYFLQRNWTGCASPPPFVHIELYNNNVIAPLTSPMTRTLDSDTTNSAGTTVADNLAGCPDLLPTASTAVTDLALTETVLVRAIIFIPYRGIVVPGSLLTGFFSGSDHMSNGGIYAETII